MPEVNAVVIVVDRFGAGYFGPYGNTWLETPMLNRLASQSVLWENVFADCPTIEGFYRAIGSGRHASSATTPQDCGRLMAQIASAGVQPVLVTDDPVVAELPFAREFRERICIPPLAIWGAAETIEGTQIAQSLAAALEVLEQLPAPFLLWVHLRGMSGAWDAPREFRESVADEDDPVPPDFIEPPDRTLTDDPDPDELLGIVQAYAGQVLLLDTCLPPLIQAALSARLASNTLLVMTSPRGYPLGEHGGLGSHGDALHEELLHLPLLLRHPDPQLAMHRLHPLVQPTDLYATLLGWFAAGQVLPAVESRDLLARAAAACLPERVALPDRQGVVSVLDGRQSLRTPAWFLGRAGDEPPRLYVKPDDRWEVNEVANRCAQVVEEGVRALADFQRQAAEDRLGDAVELPAVLLEPAD